MTASVTQAQITAIVVTCNEAAKLADCLRCLTWCDELLVVDLQSSDESAAIARRYATRVLAHERSPIVEPVRVWAATQAQHDWLLFIDPDEQFPPALVRDVRDALAANPAAGCLRLPWQFHFKGRRLDGTVWGGTHRLKRFMVHRQRTRLQPFVHKGSELLPGYYEVRIPPRDNHVRHYWMDSYRQLVEKHVRYARKEGEARFASGERFGLKNAMIEPLRQAWCSLLTYGGWRLGPRGWLLSAIYGVYLSLAAWSLLAYQLRQRGLSHPSGQGRETSAPAYAQREAA